MKKKLLLLFFTIITGCIFFTGCKKDDDTPSEDISTEPTMEQQEILDLCDLYMDCNDFVSAASLAESRFDDSSFFKTYEKRLQKKQQNLSDYVAIMQQAKDILDQYVYPQGSIPLYQQLDELQNTEEFADFLEYLGDGGSFLYIPHNQLSADTQQFESAKADGIAVYTGKNCDCIYWFFGSFYGINKNSGVMVHSEKEDVVVITGLNYELVRVVSSEDENAYTEEDYENPEIEDTIDQPATDEEIEFVMEERIADSVINEFFFENGSYVHKITGPVKNGYFDGEVTFTEFVGDVAYTGSGIAHDGVFERLTKAVPSELFKVSDEDYVCAAIYDPNGNLYSLKLSPTQGLAEMHHLTVCPEKYQVFSTERDGEITAFPFIGYKSLYRLNIRYSALNGYDMLFTLNGPVSIAQLSSDDFSSLTLYSDTRTRYLSAKVLGDVTQSTKEEDEALDFVINTTENTNVIPDEEKLINLPKETILSYLNDNTSYTENDYYSISEVLPFAKESYFFLKADGSESINTRHATMGKIILKATAKDVTGIVYEGYVVFIENYNTGIRYQFSYMVERSLFEEERDLEIAQSIMLLDN